MRWRIKSIGRKRDALNILLAVDSDSGTVIEAIEAAAAANGVVLERVEEEE